MTKLRFPLIIFCALMTTIDIYLWRADNTLTTDLEVKADQALWLHTALSSSPAAPAAEPAPGALAKMKLLELEIQRANLSEQLTQMEQQDGQRVHLSFEKTRFNQLLTWFDQVYQATGLQPHQVSIERRPADGSLTAQAVYF